jgi:hypothetical protein
MTTTTINAIVECPYMLSDVVVHAQRISATLPPDGWDVETSKPRLECQPSGVFDIVSYSSLDDEELLVDTP